MADIADEKATPPRRSVETTLPPPKTPITSVYNPITLWAAAAFGAILGFARLAFGLLLPSMRSDLGGSYSAFGLTQTANFVGYLLGTLLLPTILNRYPHRARLALIGLLIMNAGMIGTATSLDLWQLGFWRLVVGFAAALATVLVLTLAVEFVQPQSRGRASGLVWSGASLGMAVSGLIAPIVISTGAAYAWRLAWVAMGLVGFVTTWGYYHFLSRQLAAHASEAGQANSSANRTPGQKVEMRVILQMLLRPRALLFVTLAYLCFGLGYIIGPTYFISLLVSQGMPPVWTGFVWAVSGLVGIFGGTLWGRATDRYSAGLVLAASLFTAAVSTLLMATDTLWLQLPGNLIMGMCLVGPPLIVTVVLRRELAGEQYTASFSFLTAIFAVGQIIGPVIGGFVADGVGLSFGILVGAALLGLGGLFGCLHILTRPAKPSVQPNIT